MKRMLVVLLVVVCCLNGCAVTPSSTAKELFAMDTVMHLTVYSKEDSVLVAAEEEIRRLEALLSVTRTDSDIAKINQAAGEWVTVSEDAADLLEKAKEYAAQTDGAFDPTVYPAVTAWGFTADQTAVPDEQTLQRLASQIDYQKLEIDGNRVRLPAGMGIDLGGIAKGYAADQLKELYTQKGVSGVLSLGGNVMTVGQKPNGSPFTVAIQDPSDAAKTLATLAIDGSKGVVTSGDYQRYFEQDGVRYHHILDPKTAAPAVSDLASVTVIAHSAALADAYATALFVMGQNKALTWIANQSSVEAVLVTRSGRVLYTDGVTITDPSDTYTFQKVEDV